MLIFAILMGAAGAFICVWAASLGRMSAAQRPRFSQTLWARLGIPILGGVLAAGGLALALRISILWGSISLLGILGLAWLVLRHDQYSAMIRILYQDYFDLKKENPDAPDSDLLYSIVKSRRPRWTEDRIMEVCAGKDVKQLVLLLLIIEFEIHPLNDMELYERLKQKVEVLYLAKAV